MSSVVVCVGGTVRKEVNNAIPDDKCRTIPNGVRINGATPERLSLPGATDTTICVGIVGSVGPYKGSDIVTDIVKRVHVQAPQVRFYWVGPGPAHVTEALTRATHIEGRQLLYFLGYREDIAPFMASIHFLLHPSRVEAFGRVLLEAGMAGRPAVATRCGGPEELVEDGKNGLLVPVDDVGAISAAVARLALNGDERERMGMAAQETATRFDLPRFQAGMQRALLDTYARGSVIRSRVARAVASVVIRTPGAIVPLVGRLGGGRLLRVLSRSRRLPTLSPRPAPHEAPR
jgi:glycosyltransferase involved in cell wall biosynthesis